MGNFELVCDCGTQISHFSETCKTLLDELPLTSHFKRSTEGFLFDEGRWMKIFRPNKYVNASYE